MLKKRNLLHVAVIVVLLISYFQSQQKKAVSLSHSPTPSPTQLAVPLVETESVLGASASSELASSSAVLVTKVVDGDTIKVLMNDKTETVRIIGVDTPETVDPRKPVQCFGKQASDETKHFLEGKHVQLVTDHTQDNTDKYKRLLRYVYLEDGTDFGQLLISEGFAHEYTYKVPYLHQQKYKEDQKAAETAKRGLWADGVCSSPSPGLIP